MFFRFDNILEDWATLYKPISHSKQAQSKDKRFFRIKTVTQDNEWQRNVSSLKSPCMLFQVMIDAQSKGKDKSVDYLYTIYFASKATSRGLAKTARQDDDCATDQQVAMDDMVQDLLAYLYELRSKGTCPITGKQLDAPTRNALRGLMLESAEWASIPVKFNEWHLLGLQLEQTMPRNLCVNAEKYDKDNL